MGVRMAVASHALPPGTDCIDGKSRRVIDPDTDPSLVVGDVVNTVGRGATEFGVDEVVGADLFGRSGRLVFTAAIPEVADQFFLLRIDGDRRLVGGDGGLDRLGDMLELSVAGMA